MLGKLIKNEFKSTFRYYWIFFVAFLGISVIFGFVNKFMTDNENVNIVFSIIALLLALIFICSNLFISLAPIIFSAIRFNKSVLGNEGYLTNTLPITTNKIVGSKLIVATVWFITTSIWSTACSFLSTIISSSFKDFLKNIKEMYGPIFDKIKEEPLILVVALLGLALLCISFILIEYASFSFSQIFNSGRGLKGSFIMIGILLIKVIIWSVFAVVLADNILGKDATDTAITYWIFGVMAVNSLLFGAISYFMTQWSLKKHLNLQ